MKPKTANALNEMRKAVARMHGIPENELIMTVNCRENEIPDSYCEDANFADQTIARLETIKYQILNNTYDAPAYLHEILAETMAMVDDLLDEENNDKIESILSAQKMLIDELILKNLPEAERKEIIKKIEADDFLANFSSRLNDFQDLYVLKRFYPKYNLPILSLYTAKS